MSVLGLGLDLVNVDAFRRQLDDRASGFVPGTFTAMERADSGAGSTPDSERFAARFAAKEAFIKAWSSARFGSAPSVNQVDLREIEVALDGFGRPAIRLHGVVAKAVAELGDLKIHCTLTHDASIAAAVVIIES